MSDEAKYRVGMVSKLTGLSTHTLRMWEKRQRGYRAMGYRIAEPSA